MGNDTVSYGLELWQRGFLEIPFMSTEEETFYVLKAPDACKELTQDGMGVMVAMGVFVLRRGSP